MIHIICLECVEQSLGQNTPPRLQPAISQEKGSKGAF